MAKLIRSRCLTVPEHNLIVEALNWLRETAENEGTDEGDRNVRRILTLGDKINQGRLRMGPAVREPRTPKHDVVTRG